MINLVMNVATRYTKHFCFQDILKTLQLQKCGYVMTSEWNKIQAYLSNAQIYPIQIDKVLILNQMEIE